MQPLFPPWSNYAIRFALLGLVATAVGIPAVLMIYMRTSFGLGTHYAVDQPVEFDHRHHVRDNGMDCRYCHATVETAPSAGLPATEVCMGCHAQVWADSPMLEPVRRSYFSGKPIPWNRVHDLPDFVQFDHSIHIANGVGCESCHGRVDEMARVEQVTPMTMGWCLDCHRDPTPHLRPREAVTAMGWKPPSDELGDELAAARGTRRLTHCTTCHR